MVEVKNSGLFTISADPAEIRVVEVQKLRTFYDFCKPRATLCGDSRGRGSKPEDFYDFCKPRATLCGDSRARGSKTEDFLRFLQAARDPLRRFAWSRFENTISASCAQPSAEIRVVEVQKLRTFYDFCKPRAPLCGESRGRGSKTEDFLRFLQATRDPLRGSCVSERSRCGACVFVAREMAFGSCLVARAPAFAILVRGSSGLKIAALKYKRSVLPRNL